MSRALLALALASLSACDAAPNGGRPPVTLESLKNAQFRSEWTASGTARLTDGVYTEAIVPGAASEVRIEIYEDRYALGDLDGDGVADAAVVLASRGGGTGTFISLEAVVSSDSGPRHAASAFLGDRSQVKSVVIASDTITVTLVIHSDTDAMCCPTVNATQRYALTGDSLVRTPEGG